MRDIVNLAMNNTAAKVEGHYNVFLVIGKAVWGLDLFLERSSTNVVCAQVRFG